MFVGDSRSQSGPGFLPLQDFGFKNRNVPLENRASLIGLRITGRQDSDAGFGTYEEDPAARGDLSGFLHWPAASRSIGGWREVWPVIVPATRHTPDRPGGPDGNVPPGERTPTDPPRGPVTPSSSSPQSPGGQDIETGASVSGPTDPGGPTNLGPGDVDNSTADGPAGGEEGGGDDGQAMIAEPAQSPTAAPTSQAVLPGMGRQFSPDPRYQPIVPNTASGIQTFPGGTIGALVMGTNEDKQFEYFLHGDPRLNAVNRGSPWTNGTQVFDVTSTGSFDRERGATLQSLCRVLKSPSGDFSLAGQGRNVLALNIGRTGQNEAIGGLWCDKGGKNTWVGAASVRDGGPFDVTDGCKHQIGDTADGEPVSPLHFSTLAFWRNKSGDGQKDGPMFFEGPNWPDPPKLSYKCLVHLDFDENAPYEWARDDVQKSDQGQWRWWSYALAGTDPGTPNIQVPDPVPDIPDDPGDPPEGPGTGGGGDQPGQPGGGQGGGGPLPPGTGGGGSGPGTGTGGGGGGGPGTGGGVTAPPGGNDIVPPPVGSNEPPSGGPGFGELPPDRKKNQKFPTTQWPGNSQNLSGRQNHYTHMEWQLPAIGAKAQMVGRGLQHLTDQLQPDRAEWGQYIREAPLSGRLRSFGAQGGEPGADPFGGGINHSWAYTQEPTRSRYSAGTTSGGYVLMPPELDMTDASTGFRPDFPVSETFFVAAPGAALAVGEPEFATGGVKNGHSIIETDQLSPNGLIGPGMLIREHDSTGTPTEQMRLENGKQYILDWLPISVDGASSPISAEKHGFYDVDTTNGAVVIDIAKADPTNEGQTIGVRKRTPGGSSITVQTTGGDTINGSTSYTLGNSVKQYEAVTLMSDGVDEWWIIAQV